MKALIVDDNPTNLNLFKIILERKGFEVITAANGEDALQKLQGDHVDIIVSDILMPVMDGFHLLQECKSNAKLQDIPFAFVTGAFLDAKDEELALKLGVQAFIRKPVEPDNFAKILEEILVRKPAPKKRGRPRKERKNGDAEKLVSVNLMQKLEAKMTDLEEEIIERKRIEEALRNSEEQYRLLFETMAQGALYYDAEGAIISANPAAEKILGLSRDQMIGRTVYDQGWRYIREDGTDLPGNMHPAIMALKTGKTVRDVVIGAYNPIDNVFHWTNISAEPQFKENEDKSYRVFTTFDDITDRFLSYKAIQESESRITAIMENTRDAIWSIDGAFRLITANNAARDLFLIAYGVDLKEGSEIFDGIPDESRESWVDIAKHGFQGEHFAFERHYDLENGPVDLQISVNPIVSPAGQVTGVSFFGRDMTQQNKAEKALAQSEERYRMLINNAAEEIYVVQDGLVKFSKPGISRISGYSGEEIMSKPLSELIHPDDLVDMLEKHAARMAGGEAPTEYTYRAFDKSGNIRWVGAHVTTVTWEGRPATLTFQIDITDRINLESAVKESEQKYRLVVENAVEVIAIIQDGKIKFTNRALPGRLGYTAEEISTMHILDFIHPDDRQMVAEKYASRMRGDTVEDYSYRVLTKKGEVLWVQLKAVIIEWEGKRATLNFISNITTHKLAENALQESEEKYRNILEEMDEVYYEADLKGNYLFFNDALCRQLGYTREELREMNYKQYIPPEDISKVRETFI
ncbi:MAG: PAS domain S-box protein, partial [Dehalococcoidia bacterium]